MDGTREEKKKVWMTSRSLGQAWPGIANNNNSDGQHLQLITMQACVSDCEASA